MTAQDTIREILQSGRSKVQIEQLIQWIGHDHDRLDGLVALVMGTDRRLSELAAWPLGDLGKKSPHLFAPWYPQLVQLLSSDTVHQAVHRNILRIFIEIGAPDAVLDDLTEACFRFLDDPKRDIAIRAFSAHVLAKICKKIPDLWEEFWNLLELHTGPDQTSPALRNVGKKYLNKRPK